MSESLKSSRPARSRNVGRYSRRALLAAIEPLEQRQLLSAGLEGALQAETFPIVTPNGTDRPISTSAFLKTLPGDKYPDIVFLGQQGVTVLKGNGNGTFQAPQIYPVGTVQKPTTGTIYADIDLVDVNGDGILDALVVESPAATAGPNQAPGTVSVLLGCSNGTFSAPESYYTGPNSYAVTVGDLFNGLPDIVVTNLGNRTASVLLNTASAKGVPTGHFTNPEKYGSTLLKVGNLPSSVAIGDVNGDGIPDIVTGSVDDGTISILEENRNGTFQPQVVVGAQSISGLVGAFDGDVLNVTPDKTTGLGDISTPGTELVTGLNAKNKLTFTASANGIIVSNPVDVNGDGVPDSAVADYAYGLIETEVSHAVVGPSTAPPFTFQEYNSVAPYSNFYSPVTKTTTSGVAGYGPVAVVEGALNPATPNLVDVVSINYGWNTAQTRHPAVYQKPSVTVLLGFGNGTFAGEHVNVEDADPGNLLLKTPIPIGGTEGANTYPTGGTVVAPQAYPDDLWTGPIEVNGDSVQSVITTTYGRAPTKGSGPTVTKITPYTYYSPYVKGTPPIPYSPGVPYQAGYTEPNFPFSYVPPVQYQPPVQYVKGTPNQPITFAMVGTLTFTPATKPKPSTYYGAITVLINENSLLGNNDASFQLAEEIPDPYSPVGVAVGDVNGDGIPDLVVINRYSNIYGSHSGNLWIFDGNANGLPFNESPSTSYYAGFHPSSVAVAPLGGAGSPNDIIVAAYGQPYNSGPKKYYTGGLFALMGDGMGGFTNHSNFPAYYVGKGANSAYVFSKTGYPLAGASPVPLYGAVKYTDGLKGAQTAIQELDQLPGAPGTNLYGASAVTVGDFNGDGIPDIAVAYKNLYQYKNVIGNDQGDVDVLLGNGDGTFAIAPGSPIPVGAGPTQLVTGNFGGPSHLATDIAVLNKSGESLTLLGGNGDGSFDIQQVYDFPFLPDGPLNKTIDGRKPNEADSDPVAIAVGDVDGNGFDDVFVAYGGTDSKLGYSVSTLLNYGGILYTQPNTFRLTNRQLFSEGARNDSGDAKTVQPVPFGIVEADVNGDGKPDIITADGANNYYSEVTTLITGVKPTITSSDNITFTVGLSGSFTLVGTGAPLPVLTESGTLPAGLTFTTGPGGVAMLAGTPAAGSEGDYTILVTADSGIQAPLGGTATYTQTLTVFVDEVPSFPGTNGYLFTTGFPVNVQIPTDSFPVDTISDGNSALPTGLTFVDLGTGTASLVGTPTAGSAGTYFLVLTATNVLTSTYDTLTLYVESPQAPAFTTGPTAIFVVNSTGSFAVSTTGYPIPALVENGILPAGLTFTSSNGSGVLSGTPIASGVYDITLTANNGVAPQGQQQLAIIVEQMPTITSGTVANFPISTSKTFSITSTGFPTPTVSESGTLPAGISFVAGANGSATLTGDTSATGAFAITLTSANAAGTTTQAFILDVGTIPAITSPVVNGTVTYLGGTTGAQAFTITTSGFPAPAITEIGQLPFGVTLVDNGNGTATLTNDPANGTGGNYDLTLTAANVFGTAQQFFILTVAQLPTITSAGSTTFTAGTAGLFAITTGGFPVPTVAESGALPTGVSFIDNAISGAELVGTPAVGSGGIYDITLTADNGIAPAATLSFVLTVDALPSFASTNVSATFGVGITNTFTLASSGFPTPALSAGTLPAGFDGLTFIDNGNGTGTLEGTPTDAAGTYTLIVSATNAAGTATTPETLSLDLVNPGAPVFVGPTTATVPVLANDSITISTTGLPYPMLSATSGLPSWATFTDNGNGTATITGNPPGNAGGLDDITISATNSFGPATEVFMLTVSAQAPSITSSGTTSFRTGRNNTFTIVTSGQPISAIGESGTLPAGLSFVDNGDGTATISGVPVSGSGGVYDLTITASNGVSPSAQQNFVLDVDQAAAFTSNSVTTFTVGAAGSFTVNTVGFPTPAISITSGTLPSGLTLQDNNDGTATLSGTPVTGQGGVYSFTITASNGIGTSATQSFTLTIDEATSFVSANTTTFTTGRAGTFTVTVDGFPTPALSETGLPNYLTFVDDGNGTATLSGTAPAGRQGVYGVTLTAANSLTTNTQSFTLDIDQPPSFGSGQAGATFTVGTLESAPISTTGFPTATITLASGTLPTGLTLTSNGNGTGTISGTPAANTGGTYNLTLRASSGGSSTTESYALIVDAPPAITSASSTSNFAVDLNNVTFGITTTGFPTPAITEVGTLPAGISLVDNGNGTATLEGTPAANSQGAYPIKIIASNGVGSGATQSFTLSVGSAPTVQIVGGVVTITGTPGADSTSLLVSGSNLIINIDDLTNVPFALSSVSSIVVNSLGGSDTLSIGAGVPATSVAAGTGSDTIMAANSAADTIVGGNVSSSIVVTGSGNDMLFGGSGNSTIHGGSGNTIIFSGTGADSLVGGSGATELKAEGPANTTLVGGSGNDTLRAVNGNDSIVGGSGLTRIKGGAGSEMIVVGSGSTTIKSNLGHDTIVANNGNDNLIKAFSGQDSIVGAIGSTGMDTIYYLIGESVQAGSRDVLVPES